MKLFRLILLPLVIFVAGCESSTGTDANAHVGTYTLISVDGDDLPADFGFEQNVALTLLAGTLTLSETNNANASLQIRGTQGTLTVEETVTAAGTYTRSGNAITIQWTDGTDNTAAFDEDDEELTFTAEGHVLLFRK